MADTHDPFSPYLQAGWYASGGEPPPAGWTLASCHVIQRERPQPHREHGAAQPARLRLPGGRSRPTQGRLPILPQLA
jgi:hypothetical protein